MSDRFKFRTWNGEMYTYEFSLPDIANELNVCGDGMHDNNGVSALWPDMIKNGAVLEQCTGLKDKNGKLIYEGDIVDIGGHGYRIEYIEGFMTFCPFTDQEWNWYKRGSNHFKYCMDGDDYRAGKNHFLFQYESYELDIIGNIHENPELLEQA